MIRARVINSYEEAAAIKKEWDLLVEQNQLDASVSYTWSIAIWESHLKRKNIHIIVVEGEEGLQSIFPFLFHKRTMRKLPVKAICCLTNLSNLHNDLIVDNGRIEILNLVFQKLGELQKWNTIEIDTIVDGSTTDIMLKSYLSNHNYRYSLSKGPLSPYIEIEKYSYSYDEYLNSLNKKVRGNFKRKQNKINREGIVEIERIYDEKIALNIISSIESKSWKHKNSSSIIDKEHQKNFYKLLLKNYYSNFVFFVLKLNTIPLAYSMGLVYQNKFHSLKTSYDSQYKKLSPGIVLRLSLLQYCFEKKYNEFDFTGENESWKKEFTSTNRVHNNYLIFNKNLYSKSLFFISRYIK